ncbi:hypothetical protein [Oleiagrimonas sp. MCCC 1A03011]|jgi:hypothetical protein|uniref:hypothetical protein n=1 Tax=Oleiagrimonas sp. MCCC 1A03011 TaxID=1926883 RepID=UPI000DC1F7DA|nr:hypothetical protein [Oleiagrimonas sp. MCCC 1A03011]RAP56087.1 hypothetical protein BTJ49_14695 [Oleiagrimonas sp. MCCC 1A03011]
MLNRLRRHRLLWVLTLTVLSFKLVAATVCLSDTAANQHTATSVPTAVAAKSAATIVYSFDENGSATCLLSETGDCHCAHVETLPVPVALSLDVTPVDSRFVFHPPAYAFSPVRTSSLLRPPIA